MVSLTPAGKAAVAIVALLIFYFFVLPIIPNPFADPEIERSREIKILAFVKSFDSESAKLQQALWELNHDGNFSGLLNVSVTNIEAEPGKMEQNNVSPSEVPCFIVGTEKIQGWRSTDWFKEKILELITEEERLEAEEAAKELSADDENST